MTETTHPEAAESTMDDPWADWAVDDGLKDPGPFKAPKFQGDYTHGTYVATRYPRFKVHEGKGNARRAITMTNSRIWRGETLALADSVIYEKVGEEWVPIEVYPAGAELPWRSRSSQ